MQTALASVAQPQQSTAKKRIPEPCPVTKPPAPPFVPPAPYPNKTSEGSFFLGTSKLWIQLGADGTWRGLLVWPDGTIRQKLFWWREGYNLHRDPRPPLEVTGSRIESPAPPIQSSVSHGWTDDSKHGFMVNGINLAGLGCWRITGRYEDGSEVISSCWSRSNKPGGCLIELSSDW